MHELFLNLSNVSHLSDEQREQNNDKINEIRSQNGLASIFSIFEVLDFSNRAFEGKRNLYFLGRFNFSESKEEAASEEVVNPTWLDLWKVADRLIEKQEEGFRTDLYIEDFVVDEDGDIELQVGS